MIQVKGIWDLSLNSLSFGRQQTWDVTPANDFVTQRKVMLHLNVTQATIKYPLFLFIEYLCHKRKSNV